MAHRRHRWFDALVRHKLVYNQCWEDPAVDRQALHFRPDDRVLAITSGGCNALDYLLAGAGRVDAVDLNPCQTALLALKVAALHGLDHASFFEWFGRGASRRAPAMYHDAVRPRLGPATRRFWDRHIHYLDGSGRGGSFLYRGAFGLFAWLQVRHAQWFRGLAPALERLLAAASLDEQRETYVREVRPRLFSPWLDWFVSREANLALLGIPRAQRLMLARFPGGIPGRARNLADRVGWHLPLRENYFWRSCLQGCHAADCCPEYLKATHHAPLRRLTAERLMMRTATVTDHLRTTDIRYSVYVLLDHMDWMSADDTPSLAEEWAELLAHAAPSARCIYRSVGTEVDWLAPLVVPFQGRSARLGELMRHDPGRATNLHDRDRTASYGSFHIATLPA